VNQKQEAALKKLENAFLECKKAGLVFAGIEGGILAVAKSPEFLRLRESTSSCEAVIRSDAYSVRTHDTYLDSGAA
jgi:hypothetical protein